MADPVAAAETSFLWPIVRFQHCSVTNVIPFGKHRVGHTARVNFDTVEVAMI